MWNLLFICNLFRFIGTDTSDACSFTIGFTNKTPCTLVSSHSFRTAVSIASFSVIDLPNDVGMLNSRPPPQCWQFSKNVCPHSKIGDELGFCVDADGSVRLLSR